jgi:hypothetical protein
MLLVISIAENSVVDYKQLLSAVTDVELSNSIHNCLGLRMMLMHRDRHLLIEA